ncbi:hypothetical protein [Tannerella serpentiformis]|uniref:hypothetical protein n=1 Tax=Tannerella serpentiformis TaxID=712710 RepID=UPI00131AF9BB|nr:hypothetical protein [Tannerella serpentiformis]
MPSPRPIPARRRPTISPDTSSLRVEASPCHSTRHPNPSPPRQVARHAIPSRRNPVMPLDAPSLRVEAPQFIPRGHPLMYG